MNGNGLKRCFIVILPVSSTGLRSLRRRSSRKGMQIY
jgi:hypothetical protein